MLGKHINHCEDSLTAAVFSHLLHLPAEVFWRILRSACYTSALPEQPGEPLLPVDFWPSWNPDGTGNANRVVPDLFMRFKHFDLIVEAKRWDADMHDRSQWAREVTAYANEYGEENVPVRMIALGVSHETQDEELSPRWLSPSAELTKAGTFPEIRCPVHMCKWESILTECKRMQKELRSLSYPPAQTNAWVRILTDLIDLFSWHGFQTGIWFAEVVSDANFQRLAPDFQSNNIRFQNRSSYLRNI